MVKAALPVHAGGNQSAQKVERTTNNEVHVGKEFFALFEETGMAVMEGIENAIRIHAHRP